MVLKGLDGWTTRAAESIAPMSPLTALMPAAVLVIVPAVPTEPCTWSSTPPVVWSTPSARLPTFWIDRR